MNLPEKDVCTANDVQRASAPISVVVPCYNCEAYIGACLDSLLSQELLPKEIICIDDGSTDNTAGVLEEYASRSSLIDVISKDNEGAWAARLDGIFAASGDYIAFVDGDDTVGERDLLALYEKALQSNSDITVCGFYRRCAETDEVLSKEFCSERSSFLIAEHPEEIISINPAPWNKLFRTEVLKSIPQLDVKPVMFDDLILLLLATLKSDGRVSFVPEPLVNYYIRSGSLINSVSYDQVLDGMNSLRQVRDIYKSTEVPASYLEVLSVMAFVHLGVSMQFRIDGSSADHRKYAEEAESFLDDVFSGWRSSRYLALGYCLKKKGLYLKAYIASCAYKMHLFGQLITAYRWVLSRSGQTVSW